MQIALLPLYFEERLWYSRAEVTIMTETPVSALFINREFSSMGLSDTQVFVALVIALVPGILAFRLSTELYK
jgi:photosystem I subunit 12